MASIDPTVIDRRFALDPAALPQTIRLSRHAARTGRVALATLVITALILAGAWFDTKSIELLPFLAVVAVLSWRMWRGRRQRLALPSLTFFDHGVFVDAGTNRWRAAWSAFEAVRARTIYEPRRGPRVGGKAWWVIEAVHSDPDRTVPLSVRMLRNVSGIEGLQLPPVLHQEDLDRLETYRVVTGLPARAEPVSRPAGRRRDMIDEVGVRT